MSTVQFLDNETLGKMAPPVLATHAYSGVSSKYSFLSTLDVVNSLRSAGWFPVRATQSLVRRADRSGFQKHAVRLRRDQNLLNVGDLIPELVLVNSADGKSSYQLHAGLFRCICKNQMTVSDSLLDTIRLKHVGLTRDEVIEASFRVLADLPRLGESVEQMKTIRLDADERVAFAGSALVCKYGEEKAPTSADALLRTRRPEDSDPTLFNTLNVVQEHLIRGGLIGVAVSANGDVRRSRTRPVKSVVEDIRLNKALWALAEHMKEIKSTGTTTLKIAA